MAGLTRKELLAGAAAAGVVAGCGGSPKPPVDPRGWAAVKAQFALTPDVRHFDAFVLATHPEVVRDAIERHRRGLDADPNGYLREHEAELDKRVLDAAGRYLGVAGDFALTDSTTMGLGLVYGTLRAGGEAVATEHDFYATHEALRLRFGRVRKIRLYDDPATATTESIVEAVNAGIDGDTGILALTWVHSSTGVRLPLREIAENIDGERRQGMLVVVDGVHALGAVDENVGIELCDVFAAGCHKWLGGPRGTGIVWSIKAWERMRPVIPSFDGESYLGWLQDQPLAPVDYNGAALTPGGFHSFEHRWALAEAFDYQAKLGRAKVAERIRTLATRLKEGLADLPNVRLVTPMSPALSAGIVCFDVVGMRAGEVVERLRGEHRIGASVTPYATEHIRLGTGLWVDEADIDAAIRAVARL
ncbi:MAG TPA: aminotransferase class V-fold PLP-dependent enzyme [Solirubrobacteraceae bacterium]|nr:aminotransferase class V-fold PLP-dependent enzyme [Solirubrobacteraceae bacterium]